MKLLHRGHIESAELIFDSRKEFENAKRRLEGKRFELTIERQRSHHSDSQRAYLFGVVYETLAKETEQPKGSIHEFFKLKFLPIEMEITNQNTGEIESVIIPGSTKRLTKDEMTGYIQNVILWIEEWGIHVPSPDEAVAA